jgi:hypothetical protein
MPPAGLYDSKYSRWWFFATYGTLDKPAVPRDYGILVAHSKTADPRGAWNQVAASVGTCKNNALTCFVDSLHAGLGNGSFWWVPQG